MHIDHQALLKGLPAADDAAFAEYWDRLKEQTLDVDGERDREAEWILATGALEFLRNYEIAYPFHDEPPGIRTDAWYNWFPQFYAEVDRLCMGIQQRQHRPPRPDPSTSIEFAPEQKVEIREYLDRIRACVDQSKWTAKKKDDVHKKIINLQNAVERSRTPMEAILGNYLDITNAIGTGAENMKPATDALERVLEAAGKARATNSQKRLKGPEEQKQLPSPEGEVEGEATDEDDDQPT